MSIDLIRAKQQELASRVAAAKKAEQELQDAAKDMFASTGIPAMWEAIKDIQAPNWRGNGSRDNDFSKDTVPLHEHLKKLTDTELCLRGWNDEIKIGWHAKITDKGALYLCVSGPGAIGKVGQIFSVDTLRDHFVEYMAKLLPPLE